MASEEYWQVKVRGHRTPTDLVHLACTIIPPKTLRRKWEREDMRSLWDSERKEILESR
jgi:hypothetical protein